MNCLLKALAMSLGLMCVLSLKVMELLSCCCGRLWASLCIVFQLVPVFLLWSHGFPMCSLQISVLFVLMRLEFSLFAPVCWDIVACFASPISACSFVANGLW